MSSIRPNSEAFDFPLSGGPDLQQVADAVRAVVDLLPKRTWKLS
jgi:hypothetical protein